MCRRRGKQQSFSESTCDVVLPLVKVSSVIATAMANHEKKAAKAKGKGGKPADGGAAAPKPNQARLYVARKFPRWKERVLELLRSHFDADSGAVSEAVRAAISGCDEIKVPSWHARVHEQ